MAVLSTLRTISSKAFKAGVIIKMIILESTMLVLQRMKLQSWMNSYMVGLSLTD